MTPQPELTPCMKDRTSLGAAAKRAFDIVSAFVALIALSPVMLVTAILVKLDSPGPVIFRGSRVGRHGILFQLLKFRSMQYVPVPDDCSIGKGDSRITRVGTVIRRLKIDELPQLVNVILGQMSIVGPRPEMPRYAYTFAGPFAEILNVRPGLTDPATLRFSNVEEVLGAVDPDLVYETIVLPEKNNLRLRYVQNHSFAGDLQIILATLLRVIKSSLNASVFSRTNASRS